jgi:RimJ/RimL family protein N-acetyltransferase
MNPTWLIRTGRTVMRPVAYRDLADLQRIKADARIFAMMLGGVRTPLRVQEELAEDIVKWGARGFSWWTVRDPESGALHGLAGLDERPDGRGIALRFAFWPETRGHGLAREAAGAALRFGHERAGLSRIIAVARESNIASRIVLGGIGMVVAGRFRQDGNEMLLYESKVAGAGRSGDTASACYKAGLEN